MAELRACSIPRMPGSEAVLLTGMQLAALVKDAAGLSKAFNPAEQRDYHGRWENVRDDPDARKPDGGYKPASLRTLDTDSLLTLRNSHFRQLRDTTGDELKRHHKAFDSIRRELVKRSLAEVKPAPAPKKPTARVTAPSAPVSTISRARAMTSSAGLTRDEHERLVAEVARHLHLVPETTRVSVVTTVKMREDQVLGNTETRWSGSGPDRRPLSMTVRIRRDIVTNPSDALYRKGVRSGWVAPSNADGPFSGLKHTVAHEFGHVIVNASGRQQSLEAMYGHRHVSKYGAQSAAENLAEGYAMHSHDVNSDVGEAVARAGRH